MHLVYGQNIPEITTSPLGFFPEAVVGHNSKFGRLGRKSDRLERGSLPVGLFEKKEVGDQPPVLRPRGHQLEPSILRLQYFGRRLLKLSDEHEDRGSESIVGSGSKI